MQCVRLFAIWLFLILVPNLAWADDASSSGTSKVEDLQPVVRVRDFGPELSRAKATLQRNYEGIIERQEMGFDNTIEDELFADLSLSIANERQRSTFDRLVHLGVPLLILLLGFLLLREMDARSHRIAVRRQARIDIHGADWVNKSVRALIFTLGRMAPCTVLLLLSHFPVRALYGDQIWSVAFSDMLWLLMAYRGMHGTVVTLFGLRLFDVQDETARRLETWGLWLSRVVFFWLAILVFENALDYSDSVARFAQFLSILSLAFVAAALLPMKSEVIELLKIRGESDRDSRLIRLSQKYYHPFILVTVGLLVFGAFGWKEAASFILIRSYGAVIVISASLRISQWLKVKIDDAVRRAETREQVDLFSGIGGMVRTAGFFFFLYVAIRLLRLWEPISIVLDIPLLMIGAVPLRPKAILEAVLFLLFAVFVGRLLRAVLLVRVYPTLNVDVGVGYAINTLANYAVILVGVLLALAAMGVDFSSLTVVAASLGVGIGLGLQTFTENLVSGFILLFGQSVKKGDIITVGGVYGRVDDVGARSVVIKTPDNYDMLIPSKALVGGEVINWSYRDPLIRLRIPVGVTYHANPKKVRQVLLSAARRHDKVKRRPVAEVWLMEFGDSSVNYELLVYYDIRTITRDRLVGQLNFIIWDELEAAGIEIPFPQRDLHLRSVDTTLLAKLKDGGEAADEDPV